MSQFPDMLEGDEFSLAAWKAAQGQPRSTPVQVPTNVQIAYQALQEACAFHGIPHMAMFCLKDGTKTLYDLLGEPQNVHQDLMLARSSVAPMGPHKMGVLMMSLNGLDLSSLMPQ